MPRRAERRAGGADRAARERLIARGLDWLLENRRHLDPWLEGRLDPERGKAFGELALLAYCFARAGRLRDPRLAEVVSLVKRVAFDPRFRERLPRQPSGFLLSVTPHVALEHCGWPDPAQKAVIQRLVDTGYVTSSERVPFRRLDLRHLLDAGAFRHRLPSYAALYRQTLAAHLPSPLYFDDPDVYTLTHTLFYLSDFGFRDPRPVLGRRHGPTVGVVALLVGVYALERNWDLVSELLLCARCLACRRTPLAGLAWKALLEAQGPTGEIQGPRLAAQTPKDEGVGSWGRFRRNYHTTLVAILASLAENSST